MAALGSRPVLGIECSVAGRILGGPRSHGASGQSGERAVRPRPRIGARGVVRRILEIRCDPIRLDRHARSRGHRAVDLGYPAAGESGCGSFSGPTPHPQRSGAGLGSAGGSASRTTGMGRHAGWAGIGASSDHWIANHPDFLVGGWTFARSAINDGGLRAACGFPDKAGCDSSGHRVRPLAALDAQHRRECCVSGGRARWSGFATRLDDSGGRRCGPGFQRAHAPARRSGFRGPRSVGRCRDRRL